MAKMKIANDCEEEGCSREGIECYLPDNPIFDPDPNIAKEAEPDYYYCGVHAHPNGFCWGCGMFWGGVESFDFGAGARTGLCENCLSSGDFDDDEDEDMDEVYSTYPYDCEDDW